jgi:hypothetical protein
MNKIRDLRAELIEQRKKTDPENKPAPESHKCKIIATTTGAITYIIIQYAEVKNMDITINDHNSSGDPGRLDYRQCHYLLSGP